MKKICLIKVATLFIFVAVFFTSSAFALEEVSLEKDIESANDSKIALSYSKYDDARYDFTTSVVAQSSEMLLSDDTNFRLAQAANMLAQNVQFDAGVSKDSVEADTAKNSETTFLGRVFKEEDRYRPLQVFNKDGMQFEHGPVKSFKMSLFYMGTNTLSWPYNDTVTSKWKDNAVELTTITKLNNDKTSIRFIYNFLRDINGHPSGFMERVSELGLIHEFNKNQCVHIGQTWRLPIGQEGYETTWAQDLPERAMIARTFSDTRSFGVRNLGNYKYMDYDIGVYDSTRYWQHFGNGLEFDGWVNFRPLENLDSNKFGKLTLGTSLSAGRNDDPYAVWGAFIGYRYKRLHNKFEYAHADGYNGTTVQSTAKAEGFYDTLIFDLTQKASLIARFDYLNPNTALKDNIKTEYVGGLSYKLNSCMKFICAYVFSKINDGNYGHKVQILAIVKI